MAKPPSGQQHQITIQAPSSTLRGEGDIEKGSYSEGESQVFLPVFTSLTYFDHWARDIKDDIQLLKLSGVDLLKGIGEHVIVSLNIGSDLYKEFNPSELARMRSMVLKLFKI